MRQSQPIIRSKCNLSMDSSEPCITCISFMFFLWLIASLMSGSWSGRQASVTVLGLAGPHTSDIWQKRRHGNVRNTGHTGWASVRVWPATWRSLFLEFAGTWKTRDVN